MDDLLGAGKLGERFLDLVGDFVGDVMDIVLASKKQKNEAQRLLTVGSAIRDLAQQGAEGEYTKDGLTLKIVPANAPNEVKQLAARAVFRIESTQLRECTAP